ncbi:hypothetical protein [Georhizobium sp. MAB10]|uniref:hypothetical protein n=1 Tax=Georhizobium sp. MAB10 TaxID=3028319 RepID=UPI0038558B1D
MSQIGTIRGSGTFIIDGHEGGAVRYEITSRMSGHMVAADGTVTAEPEALLDAFDARKVGIKRDDNAFEIRVIIERLSPGDSSADIVVSGPVEP